MIHQGDPSNLLYSVSCGPLQAPFLRSPSVGISGDKVSVKRESHLLKLPCLLGVCMQPASVANQTLSILPFDLRTA